MGQKKFHLPTLALNCFYTAMGIIEIREELGYDVSSEQARRCRMCLNHTAGNDHKKTEENLGRLKSQLIYKLDVIFCLSMLQV